ncbi:MAG: Lrp/AsnC family transcriptional regulator [Candidatus Nitrosotenuis sp.]
MSTAYFLINARLNYEAEIIEKAKTVLKNSGVSAYEVRGTFGIYDIIVKISAASDDILRKIVLEKLRKIENIESAITMMVNEEQE